MREREREREREEIWGLMLLKLVDTIKNQC